MWQYNHTTNLMHGAHEERPYYAVQYSDELYHYGVLGMKWGIRKERPTSGGGRGRRKLTAAQKQRIKKIAIGAGIGLGTAAAIGGSVALAKAGGFKGLKARNIAKRLNSSQLQAMSLSNAGYKAKAAAREMAKREAKELRLGKKIGKNLRSSVIKNVSNSELSSLARSGTKGAERELANRGVQRATARSRFNRANASMPWNKNYKSYVNNPSGAWIKNRQNANIANYNRAVTRGNNIRTALVGAGIAGTAAGGAYGYNQYKKKKRN